jgi:DNA-binding NtrC family response regulator
MASILTVDDESGIREFLADVLTAAGHDVAQADSAASGLKLLEERPFDVLLCDLRMPGALNGMDVVRRARAEWPATQVIVLTAHGSVGTAVEAMRLGAFDFLEKPIAGPDELRALVTRALNWRGLRQTARAFVAEVGVANPHDETTMPQPTSPLRRFFQELKRRHVYNVTATYAVVSFIILQVAELVEPALTSLPSWWYRALIVVLIAGFPVALVLGWVYDITATGVKRTTS